MEFYNEFTEANRSGKPITNEREMNAAVIKLEKFSQRFERKVSCFRKFQESGWSADPETNQVNKKLCRDFEIVRYIYNDSSSSAIASGQFAYLLNSESEPFVTDEDLDQTMGGKHEHSFLMFCIALNFLVAMFVELYENKEVYFSQAALHEKAKGFGNKVRDRVELCERKLNDSRIELQNIWTTNDLHTRYNLSKINIQRKALPSSNSNWEDKQYIIRWRKIYLPIGQRALQINSSALFGKFESIYDICCTEQFLQRQRIAKEEKAREEAARKKREEKEEREEAKRWAWEAEQEAKGMAREARKRQRRLEKLSSSTSSTGPGASSSLSGETTTLQSSSSSSGPGPSPSSSSSGGEKAHNPSDAEEKLQSSSSSSGPGPSPSSSSSGGEKAHNPSGAEEKLQSSSSSTGPGPSPSLSGETTTLQSSSSSSGPGPSPSSSSSGGEKAHNNPSDAEEKLQSSNSRKRSLLVDEDCKMEMDNFHDDDDDDDDENLRDTDDDDDAKSRFRRKKILLSKYTNPKKKHTAAPVKDVQSGGKEVEESDQFVEIEDVQVPHQQSKSRISSRLVSKNDYDVQVPHQQSKSRISSRLVSKTQDSDEDDDEDDEDDDDVDVQVPHQQSKSRISSRLVSKNDNDVDVQVPH